MQPHGVAGIGIDIIGAGGPQDSLPFPSVPFLIIYITSHHITSQIDIKCHYRRIQRALASPQVVGGQTIHMDCVKNNMKVTLPPAEGKYAMLAGDRASGTGMCMLAL